MKLIGYTRVSRVKGRDGPTFISPKVQADAIKAYAKANSHKIVAWYEDLDVSGAKASRPEFDRALAAVEAGEADGLIVAKLDRFMRSLPDALKIIKQLEAAGRELVSVADNFDSSTPMGRFARDLVLRLAQLELERISESWQSAQANAVDRGVHVASRPPTGYVRKEDGRLEPDAKVESSIRELFLRRAAREGWTALATWLTEQGVVTPYGNTTWSASAMAKIISNRVYMGEARSGRHVKQNAHPAIVTRAEWEAAQLKFVAPEPREGDPLLLSGLVRCAGCRYVVKADRMRDRRGDHLGFYRCRKRHAAGVCDSPVSTLARVLDPYIEHVFLDDLASKARTMVGRRANRELEEAQGALDAADLELRSYLEAVSVEAVGADAFAAGAKVRRDAVDEATERLADAQRRLGGPAAPLPKTLLATWGSLDVGEKRELMAAAIDTVIVHPVRGNGKHVPIADRITILWRGEAPNDLPGRGKRVELKSWGPVSAGNTMSPVIATVRS